MKNKKLQTGFTLIELLTVMVILAAVGTIITSILVSTLRSGDKSTTTNDIRQSGNNAIAQMSKMIAYARSFDGMGVINVDDHTITTYDNCVPVAGKPTTYDSVTITSFDKDATGEFSKTTFKCDTYKDASDNNNVYNYLASNSADLIDRTTIDVAKCQFTCSQDSVSTAPTIGIDLVLQRKHKSIFTLLPEAQTVINFQTSVTLRNNGLQ